MTDLELREILARIDERLLNGARLRQELRFAPWRLAFGGFAAGAGFTAALVALIKIFGH